jgi:hypothetical protein
MVQSTYKTLFIRAFGLALSSFLQPIGTLKIAQKDANMTRVIQLSYSSEAWGL